MNEDSKEVADSGRRKPPAAGKGRPKGATNKMTRTIKAAIEAAFEKAGGAEYLARMAKEQPVAFMTLLGKVLPTQLEHTGRNGSPIEHQHKLNTERLSEAALREIAALADKSDPR